MSQIAGTDNFASQRRLHQLVQQSTDAGSAALLRP